MKINHTGYAEIDQQHEILENISEQLKVFCSEIKENAAAACESCSKQKSVSCKSELNALMGELISFWIGHSTYEEKLMELLPATPSCQAHIRGHQAAHAGLLKGLKKLAVQVTNDSPQTASNRLWKILDGWLGDHARHFDADLARHLDNVDSPAIDFDAELVAMLDKHVFASRPTRTKSSLNSELKLKRKRLEIRGRFESLSPAQQRVFWQAIEGKKNNDIANQLAVSVNTIKSHRAAVFRKMEVSSVLELVKIADVLR